MNSLPPNNENRIKMNECNNLGPHKHDELKIWSPPDIMQYLERFCWFQLSIAMVSKIKNLLKNCFSLIQTKESKKMKKKTLKRDKFIC